MTCGPPCAAVFSCGSAPSSRCDDLVVKKQMAFMTWRQRVDLPFEEMGMDELVQCGSGELLSQHYLALAKELVRPGCLFESP